jgi:hypothetical protein
MSDFPDDALEMSEEMSMGSEGDENMQDDSPLAGFDELHLSCLGHVPSSIV